MKIRFGAVVCEEIEVMLTASAESGTAPLAKSILDKYRGGAEFDLTPEEAVYLRDNLWGDADRVSMGRSEAAGRAFEKAGDKLDQSIKRLTTHPAA